MNNLTKSANEVSRQINNNPPNENHRIIIDTVLDLKGRFPKVKEKLSSLKDDIYIINNPEIGACARIDHEHSKFIIKINSGCFEKLNREEIMGIMAHEIGHVVLSHEQKLENLSSFFTKALILLTLFAFILLGFNPFSLFIGVLIGLFLKIISSLYLASLRQFQEYQADNFASIAYNSQIMAQILYKIKKDDESNNGILKKISTLLGTHPQLKDRIKKLEDNDDYTEQSDC